MELWDLYDEQRNPTGQTMIRGDAVPVGSYRLVIHVCIFNSKGQLLIQQRQPFKKGWPNLWDVTVGGAVCAGESSQEGAHRELLEEIGLDISFERSVPAFSSTFSQGFDDIYILHLDPELNALKLQESEVQAVRWADRDEILSMLDEGTFIPYGKAFIEYLFFRSRHKGNIPRID